MSVILACLPLLAFRPGEKPIVHRTLHAGPELASPRRFEELDTTARYFPRRALKHRANLWEERSNVAKLLEPILNARVVQGGGAALAELLADLPEARRSLGISGLTTQQLGGGRCEQTQLDFEVEHEGEQFELRYNTGVLFFMSEPEPSLYALSSTCTGALLASNGEVSAAIGVGCAAEDEQAHFPNGSRCRTCLELDGDHTRCVSVNACKQEMTRELFSDGEYYDVLEATTLACAPNYFTDAVILANELGEDNVAPQPFEHAPIVNVCHWFWNAGVGERRLYCFPPDPFFRPAIGDLLLGRVEHIRRPGSTATPHAGRVYFASGVEVEGVALNAITLSPEIFAPISNPDTNYGFGWNPQFLRPDGSDPSNLDHTYARDWIGVVSVKTATEIDGVPVSYRNRNLCTSDLWQGPDDKGRYYCKEPYFGEGEEPPRSDIWAYDYSAFYYSVDPPDLELRPMMTLAATGMMDPNIPGGHVSKIYGSTQLADPDWDNCTWPDTFEPDEMLTYATEDPVYTHTSQTYRFDKDPERNIRITLSTSWRRVFCPGAVE